ncbi:MAG: hypothetical protein R3A52_06675 [Polyangiales bacterium]
MREHADPLALVDPLHRLAANPAVPPMRRALAAQVEAELRRDLGQSAEAAAITAAQGFITRWMVVGPFDNEGRGLRPTHDPRDPPRRAPPTRPSSTRAASAPSAGASCPTCPCWATSPSTPRCAPP